jgi:hypothetical protein
VNTKIVSKLIYDAPASLRTRLQRNLPAAAEAWNAEMRKVLGVQGSPHNRSRPGQAPFRQTGNLINKTRAVPSAAKLEITIYTIDYGKYLNDGTRRIKPRPWINLVTRRSAGAVRAALYRK